MEPKNDVGRAAFGALRVRYFAVMNTSARNTDSFGQLTMTTWGCVLASSSLAGVGSVATGKPGALTVRVL